MTVEAAPSDFGVHGSAGEDLYHQDYPYYAELCALTEIRKKPGDGVALRSGIGGHSILYLNGVCRDRKAGYPTLKLCDADTMPGRQGIGISVNSHYKNANWVAIDGPEFLWHGALEPGERLTRASYQRTQKQAMAMGLLDGVAFHEHLFREKPSGMSDRDYMYEISIGSDFALKFGRDVLRARVPLDRARMGAIISFLNALNAPFRDGASLFQWRVLNNNCSHVVHNALAQAGVWRDWPTGQFFARAAFNFPVPKNEFVDLVLRTNDLPIDDPAVMFKDEAARRMLLDHGTLPTAPGALVVTERAIQNNDLYDVDHLRIIFYDNPFWGPYRARLARILKEPRYSDPLINLRHFKSIYASALKDRSSARGAPAGSDDVYQRYDRHINRQAAAVRDRLARLAQPEIVS